MADSYARVIGYVRPGIAILDTEQLTAINTWCVKHSKTLSGVFHSRRESIAGLVEGTVLVIHSLECMGRSAKDCLVFFSKIKEKGCALVLAENNIDTFTLLSEITFKIVANTYSFDSVEEKPTREIHSKPPYGWRLSDGKGSDLCEIPEEQEIIKIIKEKRDQSYSCADIAEYLTLSEVKPRRGCKRWYSMTIKRICERDNVVTKGSKATRTRETPPEIEVESDESPTLSTNGSGATSGASSNPSSRPQSRRGSIAMDEVVSKVVKTFGTDRQHRPKS